MASKDFTKEFEQLEEMQIDNGIPLFDECNATLQQEIGNSQVGSLDSTMASKLPPCTQEAGKEETVIFFTEMDKDSEESCHSGSVTDTRKSQVDMQVTPPIALKRRQIIRGKQCPLPHFRTCKGAAAPKHEYFVAMVIRSFKKALRTVLKNGCRCAQGGLFNVLRRNKAALCKWEEFALNVTEGRNFLTQAAMTVDGPETDGKTQRKGAEAKHKSYNKRFMRDFFDAPYVRVVFYYYCEFLFAVTPDELCTAMKYRCCSGHHNTECEVLWNSLKDYAQGSMITELDLEPFHP